MTTLLTDDTASYETIVDVQPFKKASKALNAARPVIVNKILAALIPPDEERTGWLSSKAFFVRRLVTHRQLSYLQRVLDLSLLVASNPDAKAAATDSEFIVSQVNGGNNDTLKALHANRELIDRPMADMSFFLKMLKGASYPCGERIPTLASHLKMGDKYQIVDEGGMVINPRLYGDSDLCVVVEAYPDRTDEIIELIERGNRFARIPTILDNLESGVPKALLSGSL